VPNKGEANSYTTGHRPYETVQQMVSRLNASAYFYDAPTANPPRKVKGGKRKAPKPVRDAAELTDKQLALLVDLLESRRVLATVGGKSYAVQKQSVAWIVCGLERDAVEHSVDISAEHCSCDDHKFRDRVCKHMLAVRNLL
jgi:hypothetical protein